MIAVMIVMTVVFAAVMAYVVYTIEKANKSIFAMIEKANKSICAIIEAMKDVDDTESKKYSEIRNMRQSVDALLSIEMSAVREAAKENKGRRK